MPFRKTSKHSSPAFNLQQMENNVDVKPTQFGRGHYAEEDDNKLEEVKPVQLDECTRRVNQSGCATGNCSNFRANPVVQPATATDTGVKNIFREVSFNYGE